MEGRQWQRHYRGRGNESHRGYRGRNNSRYFNQRYRNDRSSKAPNFSKHNVATTEEDARAVEEKRRTASLVINKLQALTAEDKSNSMKQLLVDSPSKDIEDKKVKENERDAKRIAHVKKPPKPNPPTPKPARRTYFLPQEHIGKKHQDRIKRRVFQDLLVMPLTDLKSIVTRPGASGSPFLSHLLKKTRLSISEAMRKLAELKLENQLQTESPQLLTELENLVDTDIAVDVCKMPIETIKALQDIFNLDLESDAMLFGGGQESEIGNPCLLEQEEDDDPYGLQNSTDDDDEIINENNLTSCSDNNRKDSIGLGDKTSEREQPYQSPRLVEESLESNFVDFVSESPYNSHIDRNNVSGEQKQVRSKNDSQATAKSEVNKNSRINVNDFNCAVDSKSSKNDIKNTKTRQQKEMSHQVNRNENSFYNCALTCRNHSLSSKNTNAGGENKNHRQINEEALENNLGGVNTHEQNHFIQSNENNLEGMIIENNHDSVNDVNSEKSNRKNVRSAKRKNNTESPSLKNVSNKRSRWLNTESLEGASVIPVVKNDEITSCQSKKKNTNEKNVGTPREQLEKQYLQEANETSSSKVTSNDKGDQVSSCSLPSLTTNIANDGIVQSLCPKKNSENLLAVNTFHKRSLELSEGAAENNLSASDISNANPVNPSAKKKKNNPKPFDTRFVSESPLNNSPNYQQTTNCITGLPKERNGVSDSPIKQGQADPKLIPPLLSLHQECDLRNRLSATKTVPPLLTELQETELQNRTNDHIQPLQPLLSVRQESELRSRKTTTCLTKLCTHSDDLKKEFNNFISEITQMPLCCATRSVISKKMVKVMRNTFHTFYSFLAGNNGNSVILEREGTKGVKKLPRNNTKTQQKGREKAQNDCIDESNNEFANEMNVSGNGCDSFDSFVDIEEQEPMLLCDREEMGEFRDEVANGNMSNRNNSGRKNTDERHCRPYPLNCPPPPPIVTVNEGDMQQLEWALDASVDIPCDEDSSISSHLRRDFNIRGRNVYRLDSNNDSSGGGYGTPSYIPLGQPHRDNTMQWRQHSRFIDKGYRMLNNSSTNLQNPSRNSNMFNKGQKTPKKTKRFNQPRNRK